MDNGAQDASEKMKDCIIGLDAGGSFLKAGVYLADGKFVPGSFMKRQVDSDGDTDTVRKAYLNILSDLSEYSSAHGMRVTGAAVDIPGPFDYRRGVSLMKHKYRSVYGVSLKSWFTDCLGDVPVMFIHDSTAFLYGCMGSDGCRSAAGVMIGTGFGFSLAENGKVLEKAGGGPLVSLYSAPYLCGIAEDVVSGRGITAAYRQLTGKVCDAKEIGEYADSGDPDAETVYRGVGRAIAAVSAEVLAAHSVDTLYIGGQIARSYPVFAGELADGLSAVKTLERIIPVTGRDTVHTDGAVAAYLNRIGGKDESGA